MKRNIQTWIYSWMKSYCENRKEYLFFKQLCFRYILSQEVQNDVGRTCVRLIMNFIRASIDPYEDHFLFYNRKCTRHFDKYSNSCHKGTNNEVKYNSAHVGPLVNLNHSTCIISKNAERKYNQRKQLTSKVMQEF